MIRATALKLLCAVLCAAVFCFGPLVGMAQGQTKIEQPAGLMWNRTGLPAVFPLLVKTPLGQDYFLRLFAAETGEAALAAYIKGGAFFRVLVPPGTYKLQFAHGDHWRGEHDLFGPEGKTAFFELNQPLTFAVRDFSTKQGHLVDITFATPSRMVRIEVTDQFVCQGTRLSSVPRLQPSFEDVDRYRFPDLDQLGRFTPHSLDERFDRSGMKPSFPTRYAPYFLQPEYEIRATLC